MAVKPFTDDDFMLPDLEVHDGTDFETEQENRRMMRRISLLKSNISREKKLYTGLDTLAKVPLESFNRRRGISDRPETLRRLRGEREADVELKLVQHAIARKPGDLHEKVVLLNQLVTGTYEGDPDDLKDSTMDHPKLGSVEEKLEDIRQENTEHWCAKHGKSMNEKYTNKEKRMLRKWFQQLDYDGSGEVNVEELQDPMLSSGILKTREQVVRVLANVDKNNTMGIDFEEFLLALSANKLADQSKLKHLQEMSADPVFDIETLLTADRRAKLILSICRESEQRQVEIDALYKRYDRPKLTLRDYDQFSMDLERLEAEHARNQYLHMKYIYALDGVIQDKHNFFVALMQQKDQQWQESLRRLNRSDFYKSISSIREKAPSRQAAFRALKEVMPDAQKESDEPGLGTRMGIAALNFSGEGSVMSSGSHAMGNSGSVASIGSNYLDAMRSVASAAETVESYRQNPYSLYAPVNPVQSQINRRQRQQQQGGSYVSGNSSVRSGSVTSYTQQSTTSSRSHHSSTKNGRLPPVAPRR